MEPEHVRVSTMTTKLSANRFPRLMTIGSVHRPVSDYLDGLPERPADEPLSPLDCYLIHLAVEFSPRRAAVLDLACEATWGASSVVCLANPRVARVSAQGGDLPIAPETRLDELISDFAAEAELPGADGFSTIRADAANVWSELVRSRVGRDFPIVLLPSSAFDESVVDILGPIFEALPEAVVLVLGNGRIGEDRSAQRLVGSLCASPGLSLWFLREHASALTSSGTAVVALRGNRFAQEIVGRIEKTFSTNYDFLTLVRQSCMYALEKGVRGELDARRVGPSLIDTAAQADDPTSLIVESTLRREVVRETIQRLQDEVRRLELRLVQEENRPLTQSLLRRSARKVVHFGRRHRQIFAPKGSLRERMARSMLQMGRGAMAGR
jgi:hypothetical protein